MIGQHVESRHQTWPKVSELILPCPMQQPAGQASPAPGVSSRALLAGVNPPADARSTTQSPSPWQPRLQGAPLWTGPGRAHNASGGQSAGSLQGNERSAQARFPLPLFSAVADVLANPQNTAGQFLEVVIHF